MKISRICLLLSTAAWSQNLYYFPLAADGATADGSVRTSIIIANSGSRAANVTVTWSNDDGSPRQVSLTDLGTDSKFSLAPAPGSTRILQTSGDSSSGAATVTSDQVINAWGVQSKFDSSGTLKSETAFAAVTTSTGFRIPANAASGIALYNPGAAPTAITANLIDDTGTAVGSQTFTLDPGTRVTRQVFGDLFGDPQNGTLDITSTMAVAAQQVRTSGTILDATPLTARRMKFYFPKLADGPGINATFRTTFLLTNLSKRPATITIALAQEDGSPWTASIAGQTTLAPGASTTLQSDGASAYATGAASISSDAPIGVQALITATDAQGAETETAATDARLRQQFTLPFDITSDLVAGTSFYNPNSNPVTLNLTLLDSEGAVAATTQLGPIPPGGQSTGSITDIFAGTSVLRGTVNVDSGTSYISALAVRQNQNLQWPSTLRSAAIPLNGVPIKVTSTVDDKRAVTADIGAKGGSLTLTDATGTKFTLTIPPNALFATEKIVMTPVTSAQGIPGDSLAAVQLAPDGLALLQPATLSIQSPNTQSMTPIGWYGASAPGVYLNLPQPAAPQFTMLLTHFSNAGGANLTPGNLTSVLLNIISLQDYYQAQETVALRAQSVDDIYRGLEAEFDEVIAPLIEIALASQEDNVIQCAISHAVAYLKKIQVMGADEDGYIQRTILEFVEDGRHILIQHATKRCNQDHDFTAFLDLLGLLKQDQLFGGSEPLPDYDALQAQCSDHLQFEITSVMTTRYTPGGNFKGQVSAKVPLTGKFDKTLLNSVKDPTVDLLANYIYSGDGPMTYDSFAFAPDNGCTVTANGLRPGKMTVVPEGPDGRKSQLQFVFTSGYSPTAYAQNGVQLCAFCPVYSRKLVKVDAVLYPGLNFEDVTQTCPLDSVKATLLFWNGSWATVHPLDLKNPYNFFPDWELVVSKDVLAQTKTTLSKALADHSTVESTTMKLSRVPVSAQK